MIIYHVVRSEYPDYTYRGIVASFFDKKCAETYARRLESSEGREDPLIRDNGLEYFDGCYSVSESEVLGNQ